MSELTGDPVLDYLKKLYDWLAVHAAGLDLTFPPNFATYPEVDQRIWVKNFLKIVAYHSRLTLRETVDLPAEIMRFIQDDGPRPEITG